MLERIKSTLVGLYPLDEVCNAVCLLEMYQSTDRIGAAWYGHKLLVAIDYLSDICADTDIVWKARLICCFKDNVF